MHREPSAPAGPHPGAMAWAQELVAELDAPQDFPARPQAAHTGLEPSAGRQPAPATAVQAAPSSPPQGQKHPGAFSSATKEERGEAGTPIHDWTRLRPGEPVQVWYRGQIQCVATVDEVAPSLGVMWIREALGGYRRMIHTQDTELRHHHHP